MAERMERWDERRHLGQRQNETSGGGDRPLGRRMALVVGCNGSQRSAIPALQFAEDDAIALAAVLRQAHCGFVVRTLLGTEATTTAVKDAILDLVSSVQEDDSLLFFFAG